MTIDASSLFGHHPLRGSTSERRLGDLRRRIQSPAGFGRPEGRYWFLPGFLAMPHCYVDLLQLHSLPIQGLFGDWRTFAVLDAPFAEALQSSFVAFYSAVGLPSLDPNRFSEMDTTPLT